MTELFFQKVDVPLTGSNYGTESFQGEVKIAGHADFDFTGESISRIISYTGALTSNDMRLEADSNMAAYGVGVTDLCVEYVEENKFKVNFSVWMRYLASQNIQDPATSRRIQLGTSETPESSIEVTITVIGE